MKKIIKITANVTKVDRVEIEVDLPEEAKFYSKNDDGAFFARGLILFAIIPQSETNPTRAYMLYEVERNKQQSNDFVPTDDCKSEFWLKEGLRQTAMEIIRNTHFGDWNEITKEEFQTKREELLKLELD